MQIFNLFQQLLFFLNRDLNIIQIYLSSLFVFLIVYERLSNENIKGVTILCHTSFHLLTPHLLLPCHGFGQRPHYLKLINFLTPIPCAIFAQRLRPAMEQPGVVLIAYLELFVIPLDFGIGVSWGKVGFPRVGRSGFVIQTLRTGLGEQIGVVDLHCLGMVGLDLVQQNMADFLLRLVLEDYLLLGSFGVGWVAVGGGFLPLFVSKPDFLVSQFLGRYVLVGARLLGHNCRTTLRADFSVEIMLLLSDCQARQHLLQRGALELRLVGTQLVVRFELQQLLGGHTEQCDGEDDHEDREDGHFQAGEE